MKREPLHLPFDWEDVAIFNLGQEGYVEYKSKASFQDFQVLLEYLQLPFEFVR